MLNSGSGGPLTLDAASGSPGINHAVTTVIGAPLAGTKGLVKSGSALLALNNTNTYSGVTLINAGTLDVLTGQSLGSSSVTIANINGAVLQLDGGITVSGRLCSTSIRKRAQTVLHTGSGSNTWTGPITLGNSGARLGAATNSMLNLAASLIPAATLMICACAASNHPRAWSFSARPNTSAAIRGERRRPPTREQQSAAGSTIVHWGRRRRSCIFDLAGYSPGLGWHDMPSQTFTDS